MNSLQMTLQEIADVSHSAWKGVDTETATKIGKLRALINLAIKLSKSTAP